QGERDSFEPLLRRGTDLRHEGLGREMLLAALAEFEPGLLDRVVRHLLERHVVAVVLALEGIVIDAVVAAEEGPAALCRAVLLRAVERIAVEEEAVARRHFAIDRLAGLEDVRHALGIGDVLPLARTGTWSMRPIKCDDLTILRQPFSREVASSAIMQL